MKHNGPAANNSDKKYYEDRHRIIKEMVRTLRERDPEINRRELHEAIIHFKHKAHESKKSSSNYKFGKQIGLALDAGVATWLFASTPVNPIIGPIFGTYFALCAVEDGCALAKVAERLESQLKSNSHQVVLDHMLTKLEKEMERIAQQINPPAEITARGFFSRQRHHHHRHEQHARHTISIQHTR